jgi:hypothetical protein
VVPAKPIGEIDQVGTVNFSVPADAFAVPNASVQVTLTATQADGKPLPSWLSFNPNTGALDGTPPPGTKPIDIKVTAHDNTGHEATQVFRLNPNAAKHSDISVPHSRTRLAEAGKPSLAEQFRAARHGRHATLLAALQRAGKAA